MTRRPFLLIDHDQTLYNQIANDVLGALLVTMEELAVELDRDAHTIRKWVRAGIYPPPINFGGRQKFWLGDEIGDMQRAIDDTWSVTRRRRHVATILAGRVLLLDWLLNGIPLEPSRDQGRSDSEGESCVQHR